MAAFELGGMDVSSKITYQRPALDVYGSVGYRRRVLARGDASHFVPIGSLQPRSPASSQTDQRSHVLSTMISSGYIKPYSVFNLWAQTVLESLVIISNDRQRMLLQSLSINEQ